MVHLIVLRWSQFVFKLSPPWFLNHWPTTITLVANIPSLTDISTNILIFRPPTSLPFLFLLSASSLFASFTQCPGVWEAPYAKKLLSGMTDQEGVLHRHLTERVYNWGSGRGLGWASLLLSAPLFAFSWPSFMTVCTWCRRVMLRELTIIAVI